VIDDVPDGCLLCLDEAYGEFAPEGTLPKIDVSHQRVIRMRTFSKAYGMAGARVGYAIAHADLATAFNKVRNHFGVNRVAQAGALAALKDADWLERVKTSVRKSNEKIADIARENGLTPLPTATNFVTIDCGRDGAYAKRCVEELVKRDIFVRMPFVEPQNRCIRISSGTDADLELLAKQLPLALKAAQTA
jgi:histidinol-phosphate aminotransferase